MLPSYVSQWCKNETLVLQGNPSFPYPRRFEEFEAPVIKFSKCYHNSILRALLEVGQFPLLRSQLSPHPPLHNISDSHTLGHYKLTLIAPGPGTRQPATAVMPQSLLKFFKLATPNPPWLFLCAETTIKTLPHSSPPSLCLMTNQLVCFSWLALCGVLHSPQETKSSTIVKLFPASLSWFVPGLTIAQPM